MMTRAVGNSERMAVKASIPRQAELQAAANLDEIVPLDSIALLEFAVGLEEEFSIRLEPEQMERAFLMDLAGLVAYFDAVTARQLPR